MKIACIGNSNNLMFGVVRYLRDVNIDAELIVLNNDQKHFYPECDTFDDDYLKYTKKVKWGSPYQISNFSSAVILNDLVKYDFIIACGSALAYISKANVSVNIFIPYGSDLYLSPFYKLAQPKNIIKSFIFTYYQRKGIRKVKHVMMDIGAVEMERALDKLSYEGIIKNVGIPMLYEPTYNKSNIEKYTQFNRFNSHMKELKETSDLLIFHHCRHVWTTKTDPISIKGNDRLIKGLSLARKAYPNKKITLVLLEYGPDINESKKLVTKLNLDENIVWLPKLSRKELMSCLYYADVVAGAFNISWYSYSIVYEALVMAKPLIHYREDSLYQDLYPTMYPMFSAKYEEEIAQQLFLILDSPKLAQKIGKAGKDWYNEYVVQNFLKEIEVLIP